MNVLAVAGSPASGVEEANRLADNYDVILYTGSLYLVGAIRSILLKKTDYDFDRTLKYGSSTPEGAGGR